jgi:UDP-N-acetylglucosamine transferase subunit ALG13
MVGTDHHRFDRLVDWSDEAATLHPAARVVVQHGASRAPSVAEGHPFLPHGEIRRLLAIAAGAVCHGGPGTIMDARSAGHLPICVPRDPALGEHVDDHQQRFAALVGRAGVVTAARTRLEFLAAIDGVLATATTSSGFRPRVVPTSPATEEARERLARELDELTLPRLRGPRWGRRAAS